MTATARVYGESLYELAREEKKEYKLLKEIQSVRDILQSEPEYSRLLSNPALTKDERKTAVHEAFSGRIDEYLLNFLKILTENGTLSQLPKMSERFEELYNEDKGILPVHCVSAVALTTDERKRLVSALEKRTRKTVVLSEKVDPSVLGGIRLTYGGRLFDGSVKGRLEEIEKQLSNLVL